MTKQIFLSFIILTSLIQGHGADKLDGAFQLLRDAVDHGVKVKILKPLAPGDSTMKKQEVHSRRRETIWDS